MKNNHIKNSDDVASRYFDYRSIRTMRIQLTELHPFGSNPNEPLSPDRFAQCVEQGHPESLYSFLNFETTWQYAAYDDVLLFLWNFRIHDKPSEGVRWNPSIYDHYEIMAFYRDEMMREFKKGRIVGHIVGDDLHVVEKWDYVKHVDPLYNFEQRTYRKYLEFKEKFPDPQHPDNPYLGPWRHRIQKGAIPEAGHYLLD